MENITNSLATFKATAQNLWETHQGAIATISVQYIDLVNAKPKGTKVAELYSALPKGWQDRVTEASFVALFSKANGVVRMFAEAKDAGRLAKYPTARDLVAFHGSLTKAEKILKPAKVSSEEKTTTTEVNSEIKTEKTEKTEAPVVDKFAEAVKIIDELGLTDLESLYMLLNDKIVKMRAKVTTKV